MRYSQKNISKSFLCVCVVFTWAGGSCITQEKIGEEFEEQASVAGGGVIEQDGGTGDDRAGGDFGSFESERVY